MPETILIRFTASPGEEAESMAHRLRNFGEDVFRRLRDNEWGEIDLDEVDLATSELLITGIKQANRRRLARWLEEEAARQHLIVSIEER
ncbi:MAG TPA: hypothetical protein VGV07_02200 [Devosia sp.]|jgi:hypothetical protein|uniref:hypothetical protein n=1 Tax=Devosia sp. TaxID=1871048 RepID=UPI002DDD686F|nr:hypothetical protein [Devosia sp.]HEV2514034.1 hypothetical protein [Devosia sp.]